MKFGGEYKASISQLGDCTSFFCFFLQVCVCVCGCLLLLLLLISLFICI